MATHKIGFETTFNSTNGSQSITRSLHKSDYTSYGSTIPPVWLVQAGDSIVLAGAAGRASAGPSGTTNVGAYITDATGLTQGARVTSGIAVTTTDTVTNVMRDSAPLSFDLTPWAGQWIKPATADDSNFRRGFFSVGTVSGDGIEGGNSFPNPFGSAVNGSQVFGMHITINRPDPYAITSVNDNEINSGIPNTAEVNGYVAGVNSVVSGTVGSLALTSVSQTGTTVTFTPPAPTNAAYWPEPDTTKTLTLTDGSNPSTIDTTFNSLTGYTSVVLSSPDNVDEYKLGYWATTTPVNGDRIMADFTVNPDTSFSGATEGVHTWYHWVSATSTMYEYVATISGDVIITTPSERSYIGFGIGIGF